MTEYLPIPPGDKLQEGDEFSTTSWIWRSVPDFMVGDRVPISSIGSSTQWRRPVIKEDTKKKKGWLASLFRK